MKTHGHFFLRVLCLGLSIQLISGLFNNSAAQVISTFPYKEDFGSSGCDLPAGYTNDGSDPWDFQNNSEGYMKGLDHTGGKGGCFASMDDSGGAADDSCLLTTPTFDLTSIPGAVLSFWWQNSNGSTSQPHTSGPRPWANLYLDISTNGGTTWTRSVWSAEDSEQVGWAQAIVSLAGYISTNTVLRFRGLETQSFYSDMSLDDIVIYEPPSYFPIQDSSSWLIKAWNDGGVGTPHTLFQNMWITQGDTVINSLDYLKVYIHLINQPNIYVGGIRQDTSQRVFYLHSDSLNEKMLYDFRVSLGDTIRGVYQLHDTSFLVVSKIDPIEPIKLPLSNTGLGRIRIYVSKDGSGLSDTYLNSWIEGIGSNIGLIPNDWAYEYRFESNIWTQCFTYKGTPYVYTKECGVLGIEYSRKLDELTIPNPIYYATQIDLSVLRSDKNLTIRIFNSVGILMREQIISPNGQLVINNEDYSSGIYLINIENGSNIAISKKIIFY